VLSLWFEMEFGWVDEMAGMENACENDLCVGLADRIMQQEHLGAVR